MLATLFSAAAAWRQAQLPALAQLSPPPAAQAGDGCAATGRR